MPHKEKISYKGKKIEVITFNTELHLNQPQEKIMAEIDQLLKEEAKYKKTGKLTRRRKPKKRS